MRWRRPRFTVRRLMVAVAIVAVGFAAILWVAEMRTRSAAYRERAFEFWVLSARSGSIVMMPDGRRVDRYETENDWISDAWAWPLEAKYLNLSYYPWLAVEPDPPPPKLLDHPRSAMDLPARDCSLKALLQNSRPPAWTFLWTWPW